MATTDVRRTAFDEVAREAGAQFTEWEGWMWIDHFGDPVAEHVATRERCNIWDESPLRKWDMTGPDALALADALYTNDMASLDIGQVRYGPICDEHGKMIMDGTVFKLADEHCIAMTAYDSDLQWFKQVADDRGLDVEIRDITAAMPHVQVQGPKSRDVLRPITEGADVDSLPYFRFVPAGATVGGVPVVFSRTGYSGELGFEIFCQPEHAGDLWQSLLEAGAPHGIQPVGLSAIETLRIESGLLFADVDYFQRQTDPFEVGLAAVVKLDKRGDFVGKDALQKLDAAGGPARRYVTLRLEGDVVPDPGATVTLDGRDVGTLRSPCASPTFDAVIGMAAVDRDIAASVGQTVQVAVGDSSTQATVEPLPLYDTRKTRPRS